MKRFVIPLITIVVSFGSFAYAAFPPQTVSQGGTGWGAVQTGALLYGDTAFRLATTTQGTSGYVLSLSGVPTWVGTTTAGTGLTYNGGSPGNFSVNTSQNITTLSNLSVAGTLNNTSAGVLYSTGTTSLAFTSFPANQSGTLGALIGGGNTTLTWWGLATTSQPASSNLLVSNGTSGVFGVGTTSATCGTGVSCTSFNVLGGSNPSFALAALGSAGVLGAQTATAPTVQATSTLYGTGIGGQVLGWSNAANGLAFIATSTDIGGFTTGTLGVSRGGTGVATLSSSQLLYGNGTANVSSVATTSLSLGTGLSYSGTLGALVGGVSGSLTVATSSLYSGTTGQFPYFSGTNTLTATSSLFLAASGNVGIGTTSPYRTLSVSGSGVFTGGDVLASTLAATSSISSPSLTLTGLAINSLLSTNASGVVTATSTPTFGNFNATSTVATSTLSTGGLTIGGSQFVVQQTSGNVGIGTTVPQKLLHIVGTGQFTTGVLAENTAADAFALLVIKNNAGALGQFALSSSGNTFNTTAYGQSQMTYEANGAGGVAFLASNATAANNVIKFLYGSGSSPSESMRITGSGNVGIGTTTPYSKFHVTAGASATTTVNFGEVGSSGSHACFNTKNTAGTDISFYFVGTTMVTESNLCR